MILRQRCSGVVGLLLATTLFAPSTFAGASPSGAETKILSPVHDRSAVVWPFEPVVATGTVFAHQVTNRLVAGCTAGPPSDGYRGYCATFGGRNTYYGIYGLGFPSPVGWGICAENPLVGGDYPQPTFSYKSSSAPPGAVSTLFNSLGYALSNAQ